MSASSPTSPAFPGIGSPPRGDRSPPRPRNGDGLCHGFEFLERPEMQLTTSKVETVPVRCTWVRQVGKSWVDKSYVINGLIRLIMFNTGESLIMILKLDLNLFCLFVKMGWTTKWGPLFRMAKLVNSNPITMVTANVAMQNKIPYNRFI
jgi:hypothetical protein